MACITHSVNNEKDHHSISVVAAGAGQTLARYPALLLSASSGSASCRSAAGS